VIRSLTRRSSPSKRLAATISAAITQRINAGHIRAKLIINLDVTALIDLNPGVFQTEVVGVRYTTD
jgi:antibiotic biosynthesis monooxygenase (ABM) superfamily enzyme